MPRGKLRSIIRPVRRSIVSLKRLLGLPTYVDLIQLMGSTIGAMQGLLLNFTSLREGQRPSFACLPGSTQNKYPQNDYYNFDYKNTKTANWTMSRLRKATYLVLHCVTMGGIDHVKQPSILEWPQLILVCNLGGIWLLINSFVVIL